MKFTSGKECMKMGECLDVIEEFPFRKCHVFSLSGYV